jgi:hypothetical protein
MNKLNLKTPNNTSNQPQSHHKTHNPPHSHLLTTIHIGASIPPFLRPRHIEALKHQPSLLKLPQRIGQAARNIFGVVGDAELEAAIVGLGVGGGAWCGVGGHGVDVAVTADIENGGV